MSEKPDWTELNRSIDEWVGETTVGGNWAVLDGHFPGKPILPGIAQIYWAWEIANQLHGCNLASSIENLKFVKLVEPGMKIQLRVFKDERSRIAKFEYRCGTQMVSRGTFFFRSSESSCDMESLSDLQGLRMKHRSASLLTDFEPIHYYTRHRHPMLWVDRVIANGDKSLRVELKVRGNALFSSDSPLPNFTGIEYIAQSVAIYSGIHSRLRNAEPNIGLLLGCRRYSSFRDFMELESDVSVTIREVYETMGIYVFDGIVTNCQNEVLAISTIKATELPNLGETT